MRCRVYSLSHDAFFLEEFGLGLVRLISYDLPCPVLALEIRAGRGGPPAQVRTHARRARRNAWGFSNAF